MSRCFSTWLAELDERGGSVELLCVGTVEKHLRLSTSSVVSALGKGI